MKSAKADSVLKSWHKIAPLGIILKQSKTNEEVLSNKLWEQLSANMYVFLHQMRLSDITADQLNPCPAVPNFVTISDN